MLTQGRYTFARLWRGQAGNFNRGNGRQGGDAPLQLIRQHYVGSAGIVIQANRHRDMPTDFFVKGKDLLRGKRLIGHHRQ